MTQRLAFGMVFAAGLCIGCHSEPPVKMVVLTGMVTRKGEPIPKGRITFFPVGETRGPVNGAEIVGGEYRVETQGGVPVGRHRVAFQQFEPVERGDASSSGTQEANVLPPEYNDRSKLEVEIESENEEVVLDFDLDEAFAKPKKN